MTAEQLEAARAERLRHNGHGTLTLEEARTWIEETGLCLFLPRKQFVTSIAPSFVEAIAGRRDATPDPRYIAVAEDLLVRLENDGVAVRLNLSGQPGEQPDFVVASWVLPYVYALRGDRDWRRNPQLTGSRAVSPLAIQAYKLLEAGDLSVSQLKHALGREVTESAVVRAITELWQQLRIIPVIAEAGRAAKWQLLRHRYQKSIAEGASTSQVTAISVLASIYLQAVIAASMEEVEIFLAPLTARSKVREVLRGLVATRQVHTISLGHAPHFYVAGTLPEFAPTSMVYSNPSSPISYFSYRAEFDESRFDRPFSQPAAFATPTPPAPAPVPAPQPPPAAPAPVARQAAEPAKPAAHRPHFNRPVRSSRNRKPAASSGSSRIARRPDGRPASGARPSSASRPSSGSRPANGTRWQNGHASTNGHGSSARPNGTSRPTGNGNGKTGGSAWTKRNGKITKASAKPVAAKRKTAALSDPRASRNGHKPAHKATLTAGAKAGNTKRYGFTARSNKRTKKRG